MLDVRFPLSLRNVEDLVREPGVDVSHEFVRYCWHRFGSQFANQIKKRRAWVMQSSNCKWHLDEICVNINGERHYLGRTVDHEGEVLESYVTKKRDKKAALKFMKKAMWRYNTHCRHTHRSASASSSIPRCCLRVRSAHSNFDCPMFSAARCSQFAMRDISIATSQGVGQGT